LSTGPGEAWPAIEGLTVAQREALTRGLPPEGAVSRRLTSEEAEALAQASGLRSMGVRPSLRRYFVEAWRRRSFVWNLSASRAYARNQGSYLGQAWNVIRPALDAAVFIIIFGFVFEGGRGVENIAAFITVGTFTYSLFQGIVMAGVNSIPNNIQLVRTHQFPRAVVPLATSMTEAVVFGPVLLVMVVISYLTGFLPGMGEVNPTWSWLLLPFAAALVVAFSTGCAMLLARLGARTPDLANILPFFLSLGRFGSGVMFSVVGMIGIENRETWWAQVITWQPIAVYLNLFRAVFGNEPNQPMTLELWAWAIGYAVVFAVLGFIFFWRAEETYGRD
jgi:teichoic acid transport system permease protein